MAAEPKRQSRQRLPRAERRRLIEDHASTLLALQGYDGTTLDQIARAAGVTKPVLYRHFPSKKELHLMLLARHRDELLATLADGLAGEGPLTARIREVADAWFAYVEDHPFAWAMLFQETTGDAEIQAFHRGMQTIARRALVALISAEPELDIPEQQMLVLAEFVRSGMTGLALWWLDHKDVPRSTLVEVVVGLVEHGLLGRDGR